MAAILASATSAYTDAQLAAMSGSASPLNLASIGVTPSQSFQASQLGDLSADAAALAATGFAGSSADNSIARTADVHDSLYSQSMSSLDAATLASMLASAGHSPYSPPSASGTFGLPLISEEPPSAGFLASPLQLQTQPLSGGYDQLHFVLGKRKADEFCSDMLSSTMGVPLSKRVSMPVYFGDRNAGAPNSSAIPVPIGIGMQRAPVQVQRKVAHNAIERRYRNNINDRICDLRNAVPALLHVRPKKRTTGNRDNNAVEFSDDDDDGGDDNPEGAEDDTSVSYFDGVAAATKLNKATILGKSTEYIYHLRRSNDQLKRESLYLQDVIQHGLTNGDNILALILQKAQQESAAATSLLHPPAREVRSKKK
ncbi:hypothetical protein GGI02_003370 [Coemansia sp. RSA 2322]|nr:hypothetical protein GGI02_003370 [Coemansia sp. RSA 2322]